MNNQMFNKKTKISEEFKSEIKEHFNDVSACLLPNNIFTRTLKGQRHY